MPEYLDEIKNSAFLGTPWLEDRLSVEPYVVVSHVVVAGNPQLCKGDLVFPDGVTSIGDNAFYSCDELTSVTFPDSVTSIGDFAFWCCTSLTSVTIPDSVTRIGDYAFFECDSLPSVTIPDSVTSIGNGTFEDCASLTSVTIPERVTSIGSYAFEDCASLTSVTIPESVTSIDECAFGYCTSLKSVTIENPECFIYLDPHTFSNGCDAAGDYSFTGTIYGYNNSTAQAFAEYFLYTFERLEYTPTSTTGTCGADLTWNFDESTGTLTISGTGEMNHYFPQAAAPWMRLNVTSAVIEDGVTSIGDGAFFDCTSLVSVTIPDSVTSIGYRVFYGCSSLPSVTIPEGVTRIGDNVLAFCDSLTAVTILNPDCEIPYSSTAINNGFDGFTGTIYGYDNSTAQAYAEDYGCKFESLGAAPEPVYAPADVDGNGEITVDDTSAILQDISGQIFGEIQFSEAQFKAADVKGDGRLTVDDVSIILQYIAAKLNDDTVQISDFI